MGQGPGTAEVTASVGSVSATASVSVSSPSTLEISDGNGQTAPAGQAVPTAPAVRVADAQDQPVADVRIRFQVASGSGTVTEEIQETDADGVARVGSWVLGSAGINHLTATVEGADAVNEPLEFLATTTNVGGYDITIHYLGEYTSDQLLAFAEAELRWESVITGDLPDVNQNLPANQCGDNPATNGPFDDVTIFVTIEHIDGVGERPRPGGPLLHPGRSRSQPGADLTVIGRMQFDEDDVDALEQEGSAPRRHPPRDGARARVRHAVGRAAGCWRIPPTPIPPHRLRTRISPGPRPSPRSMRRAAPTTPRARCR